MGGTTSLALPTFMSFPLFKLISLFFLCSDQSENTSDGKDETTYDYTSDSDEGLDDESISERILTAALQFVPEYGWTAQAIAEGAKIEGFSGMAEGMFHREGGDLVLHFINMCNLDLGDYLADNSRTQEENRKNM